MFPTVRVAAVGIVSTGVSLAAFAALASQAEAQSAVIDVLAARVMVAQGGAELEFEDHRA